MKNDDLIQIGDQMVKVLTPVYNQLDRIEDTLTNHGKRLKELQEKQDAQTGDIMELQKKADITNDRFVRLEDKIDQKIESEQKEHNKIKKFVGMPLNID